MTATPAALIARAVSQVGTVETGGPHGNDGNVVPYWNDVGLPADQGQSWCTPFVLACVLFCGIRPVTRSLWCWTVEADYKAAGRWYSVDRAQPGDQIIFGIGNGHTGILESIDHKARTVTCIEGNTSPGRAGSQTNGGGVYRRTRSWSVVHGAGRPYFDPAPQPTPTFTEDPEMMFADVPGGKPDSENRIPVWQTDKDGNLYNWNGAPFLKSLSAITTTHPPICGILPIRDGSATGVVLVGDDVHFDPTTKNADGSVGSWARSTFVIHTGM